MDGIKENDLARYLEDFTKEQTKLMNELKQQKDEKEDREIQRELVVIQSIVNGVIKLRNIKRKKASKY